ncbi:VanW family protein [Candidatus Parcubacteria bacterium]|nr:VanW family protein [Candidatus Parcubacteria bacterium]
MSTEAVITEIRKKVHTDMHGRKAISFQYPILSPYVVGVRRFLNIFKNRINKKLARKKTGDFLPCVIARHSSPLFRKLGNSNPELQHGKIKNLTVAIDSLNGLIINPGEVFSFWNIVGAPTKKKGYVTGMLLSAGKVIEGTGGGLCQLSNLLYWLLLHAPVEIVERQHHSMDVFPDSGRSIPFGAGATIYYNLIDLKVKNTSKFPIQLKLWLSESQLKGQVLSTHSVKEKYHLEEGLHYFIQTKNGVYRYNEVWRSVLIEGQVVGKSKVMTNCAPVLYEAPHIDFCIE